VREERITDKYVQAESVHVHLSFYMDEKMDNVQVENVKDMARILTCSWPLDKTKTSNPMWKNCVGDLNRIQH
jgi:hypothetical protein